MHNANIKNSAFTLIELLVVIGVIGILAGILLSALPAMQGKAVRGRVTTELKGLELAINSYKAKHGFYPPSNTPQGFPNPLFYELTGTIQEQDGGLWKYRSRFADTNVLQENQIQQLFQMKGFLNMAPVDEQSDLPNFYKSLKGQQVRTMETNGGITFNVLAAGRRGMDGQPAVWHYTTGNNATNTHGEFDLWAEIEFRGEKVIIGNWDK